MPNCVKIFLNGFYDFDQLDFYDHQIKYNDSQTIAVNGGMKIFDQLDLRPHWLIGDLDSADATKISQWKYDGVQILDEWIGKTDKDLTDGQLAIEFAIRKLNADHVVIFGGFPRGNEIDHFLANLKLFRFAHTITNHKNRFTIEMQDVRQAIYFVTLEIILDRKSENLQRLSIFADRDNARICESFGLRWDVSEMWIDPDQPLAVRNEFIADQMRIELDKNSDPIYVTHNW